MKMNNILISLAFIVVAFVVQSCGIYSFTGTSIQPDVKSITINYFEYLAPKMNPSLSNQLTEALQEKFIKLTKLELVDIDGDLEDQHGGDADADEPVHIVPGFQTHIDAADDDQRQQQLLRKEQNLNQLRLRTNHALRHS